MNIALDANILLRCAEPLHPAYKKAEKAIARLLAEGHQFVVFPQVLIEFWVVATRPVKSNGLGLSFEHAQVQLEFIKTAFTLSPNVPATYWIWEELVRRHRVLGKNAHDAHIVAAMLMFEVSHILTFDLADFRRFYEITVMTPDEVINR